MGLDLHVVLRFRPSGHELMEAIPADSDGAVVNIDPRALTKAALVARAASIASAGAVRNFPPLATPPGDG